MAEIDQDAPKIDVLVDIDQAKKSLAELDKALVVVLNNMNKNVNIFSDNFKKTFSDLKGGKGLFSTVEESSNTAKSKSQSAPSSQQVAQTNKDEQIKTRAIELEQRATKQRADLLQSSNNILKATTSLPIALAGLIGGGVGVKSLLDFSHHANQLQNFLKGTNANATNALAYRNELEKRGVDENSYWGSFQAVNTTLRNMQQNAWQSIPENERYSLQVLKQLNPDIQLGVKEGGEEKTDVQVKNILDAIARLGKDTAHNYSQTQKMGYAMAALGGDFSMAQAALAGKVNPDKAALAQANSQAKTLPELGKVDREKQQLAITYETEKAKFIANITPVAIEFLTRLNNFVANHGNLVLATTSLADFGAGILGFIGLAKLATGSLLGLGRALPKVPGAGSSLIKGVKWAGNRIWDGTKWVARKGVNASEWVERNPTKVAKVGSRALGLPLALAYEGTVGMVQDADSTSLLDAPAYNSDGKLSRAGRGKKIEQELQGKISQSSWNNKFYVQTKDGAYVYIDSNFYEPIEQIKKRLKDKITAIPSNNSNSSTGGVGNLLFPAAHAGDLAYDKARRNGNIAKGSSWHRAKVPLTEQERIAKMLREGYAKDGYLPFQADAAIASINRESGFDIHAVGDNGKSKGLFQFDKYRQGLFKKRYHHPIEQSTAQEQIEHHFWELKNNEKKAGDQLRKSRNAVEANTSIVRDYERSANQQSDIQKQLYYLPTAQRLGHGYNLAQARPTADQIQSQVKQQRILNDNRHTSSTTSNDTHNNNATINIHVANGSVENITKALKQGQNMFPKGNDFNLINGVS